MRFRIGDDVVKISPLISSQTIKIFWAIIWRQALVSFPATLILAWIVGYIGQHIGNILGFDLPTHPTAAIVLIFGYSTSTLWVAYSINRKRGA